MRIRKTPFYTEVRGGAEPCRFDLWDPYQMWKSSMETERVESEARSLLREVFERR